MKTQRSALLGLALGLAAFGAGCKDTTTLEIPPTPPPPIVVTVTPQQLELEVGGSAILAASVTGGAATDAKTVTWSTSDASVASVDGTGKVTAVGAGVATVTATSTADAASKGAAAVTVTEVQLPAAPSVSIKSITTFATNVPVALNNVFGQIDITLNLDVPAGAKISALRTYVGTVKVCEQTFSGGAEVGATEEIDGASEIICSVNTAAYTGTPGTDAQATVTFPNGPGYKVRVEIVDPQGTTTAQIESADMIFNNPSFIVAMKTAPTNCTTGAVNSGATFWCGGDITGDFLPVNFSTNANDAVNSITLIANGAKAATDAAAPWSATLQKASSPGASSVGAFEGPVVLTITSTTVGGQTGPVCINPDPVLNPVGAAGCTGPNANTWVLGTGGVPATAFLLDNVAPTITLFDFTPATLGCAPAAACYVSGNTATPDFAFSVRSGFFAHTDAGVGTPTATFMAGVPGSLVAVTTAATLAESVVPNYISSATTCDKLQNCRTQYASTAGAGQNSATGAQLFGVDSTDPTAVVDAVTKDKTTNVLINSAYTISYADAGVGPSGFSANPARVQLKKTTPAGSTCYVPDSPFTMTSVACLTNSGAVNYQADDGIIDLDLTVPGTGEGYWQVDAFVLDQATNFSKPNVARITLQDLTPPVLGGIGGPSSLPGGTSATFTAGVADNIDLGWLEPYITYGANVIQYPNVVLGAYGVADGLLNSATGTFNVAQFVRAIEPTNAGDLAGGVPVEASQVDFDLFDVAGNMANANVNITAAVQFAAGGPVPSLVTIAPTIFAPANPAHGLFIEQAPSNTTVCRTTSGCGSTPTSTVLSVTMTGPNATFANPFTRVEFWYQDPVNGRLYLIGTGAASASDNTVTSTRTWTYSYTWTVTGLLASDGTALNFANYGLLPILAVGVHSSGSGLSSTNSIQTLTIN